MSEVPPHSDETETKEGDLNKFFPDLNLNAQLPVAYPSNPQPFPIHYTMPQHSIYNSPGNLFAHPAYMQPEKTTPSSPKPNPLDLLIKNLSIGNINENKQANTFIRTSEENTTQQQQQQQNSQSQVQPQVNPINTISPHTPTKSGNRKLPPPGLSLKGKKILYRTKKDSENPNEGLTNRKQLETTTITLYPSEYTFGLGCLIAVNSRFICYAVRGEMIRVLNVTSMLRHLIKGHSGPVTDLRFCESAESIFLASSAKDGNVFVWEISVSSEAISHTVFARVPPTHHQGYFQRVAWHPTNSKVLAASGGDNVGVYLFDLTCFGAEQDPEKMQSGTKIFYVEDTEVLDVCFSSDGQFLSASCKDGSVRIFSVESTNLLNRWSPHDGANVSGVYFLKSEQKNDHLFITGGNLNSQVRLWDLLTGECLQSIEFDVDTDPAQNELANHMVLDPTSSFLFLASTKQPRGFIFHINSSSKMFDYLTEFEVNSPILSFTVVKRVQTEESNSNNMTNSGELNNQMQLYCVQSKCIQWYGVNSQECYSELSNNEDETVTQLSHLSVDPAPSLFNNNDLIHTTTTTTASEINSNESNESQEGEIVSYKEDSIDVLDPLSTQEGQEEITENEINEIDNFFKSQSQKETNETQTQVSSSTDLTQQLQKVSEPSSPSAFKFEGSNNLQSVFKFEAPTFTPPISPIPTFVPIFSSPSSFSTVESKSDESVVNPSPSRGEENSSVIHERSNEEHVVSNNTSTVTSSDTTPKSTPKSIKHPQPQQNTETTTTTTTTTTPTKQKKKHKTTDTPDSKNNVSNPSSIANNVNNNNNNNNNITENKPVPVPSPNKGKNPLHTLPKTAKNAANNLSVVPPITDNSSSITSPEGKPELVVPSEENEASSFSIRGDLKKIENNLALKMERLIQQQVDKMYGRLEKERIDREKTEKERFDRIIVAVSQTLNNSLTTTVQAQVEKTIKKEMQVVLPILERTISISVENSMAPLKKSMIQTCSTKMETLAKESLDKISAVTNAQAQVRQLNTDSIRDTVERTVQQSFVSVFQENLLPAFEGASQAMLRQIHASLDKSTKDATQQLVQHVQQQQQQQQVKVPPAVVSPVDNLLTEQLRNAVQTLSEISNSLQNTIISTQSKLVDELLVQRSNPPTPHYSPALSIPTTVIPPQRPQSVELSFPPPPASYNLSRHSNAPVSRSPSVTPSPTASSNSLPAILQHLASTTTYSTTTPSPVNTVNHTPASPTPYSHQPSTRDYITQLLTAEKYEEAFDFTLSAMDLSQVVWLISQLNCNQFFSSPPRISQCVLLSLIQQLGYDLSQDSQIKIIWLQQALLSLDPSHPTIKEHVSSILTKLQSNLEEYGHSQPGGASPVKILTHIVKSILR